MISAKSRRRRMLRPTVLELEPRQLLAIQVSPAASYTPIDLAGPTAAAGPDGFESQHFQLTNIPVADNSKGVAQPTQINWLTIQGPAPSQTDPSGFIWMFGQNDANDANPMAGPRVEVIVEPLSPSSTTETVDVYFSGMVQQVDTSTGQVWDATLTGSSPLTVTGGFTLFGSLQQQPLPSFQPIPSDPSSTDPPDVVPTLPSLSYSPYQATFVAQITSPTSNPYDGDAGIQIAGLPSNSTLTNVALSDEAGLQWGVGQSYGRSELGINNTFAYSNYSSGGQNYTSATFYFPPLRDEAGGTMTATFQVQGSPGEYVVDVPVPSNDHTNPVYREPATYPISQTPLLVYPTATPDMVTYTGSSGAVNIQTVLDMAGTGVNNFELEDGVYQINEPLMLHYPLTLQGADKNNVDLEFTFSGTAQYLGAINFWDPGAPYSTSHVTLENFAITFSQSNVQFGDSVPAVIQDEDIHQAAKVDINIQRLTIRAPGDSGWGSPDGSGNYQTVYTIDMGPFDSGTIEGNTIYGGTIQVSFGPWTISGNTFVGSVAGTICDNALAVDSAHDVVIQGNAVTDPSPGKDGLMERFVTLNNGGYNIDITGNSVSQNVGDQTSYDGGPFNTPEEILPEQYGTMFEGNTSAVSTWTASGTYNPTAIEIPSAEMFGYVGGQPMTAPVLFILDGGNKGTSIPITQELFGPAQGAVSTTFPSNGLTATTYFVLASALPQGTYDFAIASAYNGFTVSGNTIDTRDTVSEAVVLTSYMADVSVTGNTLIGDQTAQQNATSYSEAVRVSQYGAGGNSTNFELGLFDVGYDVSFVAMFGVVIGDNTIINPIGGIHIYEGPGNTVPTTYARSYTVVTLTNNTFVYSYQNLGIIHIGDANLYALPGGPTPTPNSYSEFVPGTATVEYDSNAANFVDPNEFWVTTSGNTVEWASVAAPASDTQIDAAFVNGSPTDQGTYATPALLATTNTEPVTISSYFNAVGITPDDDTGAGGLDSGGDSLSATTLEQPGNWSSTLSDVWGAVPQPFFLLGPVGDAGAGDDAVQFTGQTITLPQGQFSDLLLLALATGSTQSTTITVNYTTGPSASPDQTFSDFVTGGGSPPTVPHQAVAATLPYYNTSSGPGGTTAYLYGYDIQLDATRTVASITLSSDSSVYLFAVDLSNAPAITVGSGTNGTVSNSVSAVAVASGAAYFGINSTGDVAYVSAPGSSSMVTDDAKAVSAVAVNGVPGVFVLNGYGSVEFYQQAGSMWSGSTVASDVGAKAISGISLGSTPAVFVLYVGGTIGYYDLDGAVWNSSPVNSGSTGDTAISGVDANGVPAVFALNAAGNIVYYWQAGSSWNGHAVNSGDTGDVSISGIVAGSDVGVFGLNAIGNVAYYYSQDGSDWSSSGVNSGDTGDTAISGITVGTTPAVFALNAGGNVSYYSQGTSSWNVSTVNSNAGDTVISGVTVSGAPQLFALNGPGNVYGYAGTSWTPTLMGQGVALLSISAVPGSTSIEYFEKDQYGDVWYYETNGSGTIVQFGGQVGTSVTAISAVPATSTTGGYPSVFLINSAGNAYEIAYNGTSWTGIGTGTVGTSITAISGVAAASSTNSYPSVFALNSAGNVYDIELRPSGMWGGIGTAPVGQSVTAVSGVAATSWTNGYPSVFALNSAGIVLEIVYNPNPGSWGGFGSQVGTSVIAVSGVAVASSTNPYPSVFALNSAGNLYDIAYNTNSGSWGGVGGQVGLAIIAIGGVAETQATNGYPSVFAINSAGSIYDLIYSPQPGKWSGLGGAIDVDIIAISPISNTWLVAVDASRNVDSFEDVNGSWVLYTGSP